MKIILWNKRFFKSQTRSFEPLSRSTFSPDWPQNTVQGESWGDYKNRKSPTMPTPFWVHCNRCAVSYSRELPMYLLTCSHTICKICMRCSSKFAWNFIWFQTYLLFILKTKERRVPSANQISSIRTSERWVTKDSRMKDWKPKDAQIFLLFFSCPMHKRHYSIQRPSEQSARSSRSTSFRRNNSKICSSSRSKW